MLSRRAFGGVVAGGSLATGPTNSTARTGGSVAEISNLVEGGRAPLGPEKTVVRAAGFRAAGDGGGGLYRRVADEPRHLGKFRSADGGWWELAEAVVTPQMFGAVADGIADDAPALAAAIVYGRDIHFGGKLRLGSDPGPIAHQLLAGMGHAADTAGEARGQIIKGFDGPLRVGELGRLADLEIVAAPGAGGDTVQVMGSRAVLTRVTSTAAARDGFRIGADDDPGLNANFWRLESCIALKAGRHGLHIHHTFDSAFRGSTSAPNCNAGVSIGFDARECGGSGVHLGHVTDCTFIGDGVQNNGAAGFVLSSGAKGHKIIGLYAEANLGGEGLPGDEILINSGATENLVLGLRSGQLAGAGLRDDNAPGLNMIDVFDTGVGCQVRRDGLTLLAQRKDQDAYLAFVVGPDRVAVAELVGNVEGETGGSSTFRTKRDRNTPRDAWGVDDRQTFTTFRGEASKGWGWMTPAEADRVEVPRDARGVDLEPASALATLTVALPADPVDGQLIGINTTARIRALTVDGGDIPVRNGSGVLPAGGGWTLRYRADRNAWYRQG